MSITGFILLLSAIVVIQISTVYSKAKKTANTFGSTIIPYLIKFAKMKLSIVLQMLSSRASSAGYLAAVVYLKKIRRISYDRLYEKITETKTGDEVRVKHWKRFALQNALYLLSTKNNKQRTYDLRKEPYFTPEIETAMQPSVALQEVVNIATKMDTTLWFDKDHDNKETMHSLLAAGGATTCYNLLRWSQRFNQEDPYWQQLTGKLSADWSAFNHEAYWLHQQNYQP
jgi:hypothetical protein